MDEPRYATLPERIETPWDELAGQRSWRAIEAELERPRTPATPASQAPRGWSRLGIGLAAATLLAGMAAAAGWAMARQPEATPLAAGSSVPAAAPSSGEAAPSPLTPSRGPRASAARPSLGTPPLLADADARSVLAFAPGARARLEEGAKVRVLEADSQVRGRGLQAHSPGPSLAQEAGAVHYEVESETAGPPVVVEVAHLYVIVQGASFHAELDAERVTLRVEQGEIQLDDGERALTLRAGEDLQLERGTPRAWPTAAPAAAKPSPTATAAKVAPARTPDATPENSAEAWMDRARQARSRGELERSAEALRRVVEGRTSSSAPPLAWIELGRVESRRGHHVAAAEAFEAYAARYGGRSLAEDALYDAHRAWLAAGRIDAARDAARRYLDAYPGGLHAEALRAHLP